LVSGCSGPRAQDPGRENRTAGLDVLGFGRRGGDRTARADRIVQGEQILADPPGSARSAQQLESMPCRFTAWAGEGVFLFRAPIGSDAPIPDVGRVPGRSGDGTEQRLCFVQPISGASPLNRCWPTFLPISYARTSSSTAASAISTHI